MRELVSLRNCERVLLVILAQRALSGAWSQFRRLGVRGVYKQAIGAIMRGAQAAVPGVSGIVEAEKTKALAGLEKDLLGDGDADALVAMPAKGLPAKEVELKVTTLRGKEASKSAGEKRWGGIYHEQESELTGLQARVWAACNCTNALYPGVFPSLRKFEAELVSMVLGIVHGHEVGAAGLLSSGGTESVLLAALAYREQGRLRGIARPQIIASLSAHPAILKACHYFGMDLIKVAPDPNTFTLRADLVRPHLTSSTVAIYSSAPSFSHGVVDPIEELGALATEKGIGLHVDNCLGGFLLSFLQKEGLFTKPWDFAVPGVTSISIDVHKYGCSSKGASVVAFRDAALRALTYVPSSEGCEGLYVTPTLQGSRSGAVIAAAWATVVNVGDDGYRHIARDLHGAHLRLKREVAAMKGIRLCVDADLAQVPICGDDGVDVYALATLMEKRGWGVFTGQKPPTLTIPVGEQTPKHLDAMIEDLRSSLDFLLANPDTKPEGNAAVYGAAAAIPDELLDDILRGYVDVLMKVKPA